MPQGKGTYGSKKGRPPKKPKTNARVELNKLTSLSRNQKINYLEKIKQNPNNILRILYNARRVANSQRPPQQ